MQERFIPSEGISLSQILPEIFVKGLPLVLIILGYSALRKNGKSFNFLIPYLTGSGILLLTYPTIAFEYSIPCLFCFIPLIFYWTKYPGAINSIVRWSFVLFLFLASWPDFLLQFMSRHDIVKGYLVVSMIFLSFPLIYAREFLYPPLLESVEFALSRKINSQE